MAILLRNPERYQPVIEDALRRAAIPAYFSRGTARPDPAGRAFLALLACAAEKCSASRFAEYLSLGQVPASRRLPRVGCRRMMTVLGVPRLRLSEPLPAVERRIACPVGLGKIAGGRRRDRRARPLGSPLEGLEREFEIAAEITRRRRRSAAEPSAQCSWNGFGVSRNFALPLIEALG